MDQAEKLRELVRQRSKYITKPFRVITVASGKGGVGKTNFVLNLAVVLQRLGFKITILDADFGMANIDILWGIKTSYSIYDILYNNKSIEDVIVTINDNIRLIPGGSGIRELSEIDADKRTKLSNELSKIQNTDILLVDTGAGLSNTVLNFVEVSDDVIVITNPEPTALTDAYGLMKVIINNNINNNLNLVINRVKNQDEAKDIFEKISSTIKIFLDSEINYLGYIYEDSKVGQAVREQRPFTLAYPNSQASSCVNQISSRLLGTKERPRNNSIKDYFMKLIKMG
jgi:flagellar biosynthesis protein FlhG